MRIIAFSIYFSAISAHFCVTAALARTALASQRDSSAGSPDPRQTAQNASTVLATFQPLGTGTPPAFDATQGFQYVLLLALRDFYLQESNFTGTVSRELGNLDIFPPSPNRGSLDNYQRLLVGLAATYANLAYNNQETSSTSAIWNETQLSVDGQPNATSHPFGLCSSVDLTGAIYSSGGSSSDPEIASSNIGMFLALSGYLYEIEGLQIYFDAALQVAGFVQNYLITGNSIADGFELSTCLTSSTIRAGSTGAIIEGLSVLASHNSSWIQLLNNVTSAAVTNQDFASLSAGVNNLTLDELPDAILLRGLSEALQRQNLNPSVVEMVEKYTTSQFNASLQVYNPDTNDTADIDTVMSALYASNAAAFTDPRLSTNISDSGTSSGASPSTSPPVVTPSSTPSTTPSLTHLSSHVGAIVGGAIGGLVICAILIFWSLRRRRRLRASGVFPYDTTSEDAGTRVLESSEARLIEPFLQQSPITATTHTRGSMGEKVAHLGATATNTLPQDRSHRGTDTEGAVQTVGAPAQLPVDGGMRIDDSQSRELASRPLSIADAAAPGQRGRWNPDEAIIATIVQRVVQMLPTPDASELPPEYTTNSTAR